MGTSVKANPQVKVTCKRTSKKLNIEALDKNTINEIKKSYRYIYIKYRTCC